MEDDLQKVSGEHDNFAAEKGQLEARYRELSEAHTVEMTKISEVDHLRAGVERDAAHIMSIERALLHTRELVHGRATKDVSTLKKMLRDLKAMTNGIASMKAVT